jgi:hypothetical protein
MRSLIILLIVFLLVVWAQPIETDPIYTVVMTPDEVSKTMNDRPMHPAAAEFQHSLEMGYTVACKDAGEYEKVLDLIMQLRKEEMNRGRGQ